MDPSAPGGPNNGHALTKGKALSNAMRTGKRALAGVAAGALALGMLTIASAPVASAKPSVKPKAAVNTTTATIGPVRYSVTGSAQDPVYTSPLKFAAAGSGSSDDSRISSDDTIVLTLTTAPDANARLWLSNSDIIVPTNPGSADDTVTLSGGGVSADDTFGAGGRDAWNLYPLGTSSTDDTVAQTTVGVNFAGTYSGRIDIYTGTKAKATTNIIETVTFSFTTVGKPATMTVNPTSVALTASTSSAQNVSLTLADSAGNTTQPGAYDSVLITSANTAVATTTPTSGTAIAAQSFDDSALTTLGVPRFTITGTSTAGSTSVTAAPAGTLAAGGITTQTVAVTSGSTATVSPSTLVVSAPTTQIYDDTAAEDTANYLANVNLVRSLTVTGAGSTPNAGVAATVTCAGSFTGLAVGGTTISSCSGSTTVLATADAAGTTNWVGSWTAATAGSWIRVQVLGAGTGRVNKAVQVQLITPTPFPLSSPSGSIVQKTGTATDFAVSITDDFDNPYVGYGVQARATGTTATGPLSTRAVTNASGQAVVSVPAPSATYTGSATIAFTVTTPGGAVDATLAPASVTAVYSASGDVTSITVTPSTAGASVVSTSATTQAVLPQISIPSTATGLVGSSNTGATYTVASATAAGTGSQTPMAQIAVATSPANSTVVTAPAGVKVSRLAPDTLTNFADGGQTATIASGGSVYVWATKTGIHDLTFTSGTLSVTVKIRVVNSSADAYNIAVTPASQNIAAGAFGTATLKVTDAFGNPVTTTDDTGAVTVNATGEVRLGGFVSSSNFTTNAAGEATITLLTGTVPGDGALALTPKTSNRAIAWAAGYVRPTGYPAPVTSAAATAKVVAAPSVRSITITGERTTVSGKSGIKVDGNVVGIENGKTVVPYIRFPGETTFTAGSARPVIADGSFTWQRKTGKRVTVYVTNDDGSIKSNNVTIQAN
jgi:hypothetical protein